MTDARTFKPTGTCHDCGKPIVGDRRVCGQCAVTRNRASEHRNRTEQRKARRLAAEVERERGAS